MNTKNLKHILKSLDIQVTLRPFFWRLAAQRYRSTFYGGYLVVGPLHLEINVIRW